VILRAHDIHAAIGAGWPAVLVQLGIADNSLRLKKSGPCPACGGRDRFTFDNRRGRGDFICRGCGAGDGFALLQRVHGWTFSEARKRVLQAAGLADRAAGAYLERAPAASPPTFAKAGPPQRVLRLLKGSCAPVDCADAVTYLESRCVWPLRAGCTLRAHPSVEYFHQGERVGRYPALVAGIVDEAGELVTAHVTYLHNGGKLALLDPRKVLSPLQGRPGCAVRLLPLDGEAIGVAEGIETALSASALHDHVPTWAALNTTLLERFEPPHEVRRLIVFADRDAPGLEAAARLMERLQGNVRVELRVPGAPHKDWNDVARAHLSPRTNTATRTPT
jgi:putative DNA primase/helicase